MGHTYFFEDGVETGNSLIGNLGILTRVSNAMLNTDTTPATYWITHPNNTIRGNRAAGQRGWGGGAGLALCWQTVPGAAPQLLTSTCCDGCLRTGSAGYGIWYRLLDNPEGPSATAASCPKFTPLAQFKDNVAHSNMFYGLHIHPEYLPIRRPCDKLTNYQQVPAVFDGLVSYKNGVKGVMATQVGLVQFRCGRPDSDGGRSRHAPAAALPQRKCFSAALLISCACLQEPDACRQRRWTSHARHQWQGARRQHRDCLGGGRPQPLRRQPHRHDRCGQL